MGSERLCPFRSRSSAEPRGTRQVKSTKTAGTLFGWNHYYRKEGIDGEHWLEICDEDLSRPYQSTDLNGLIPIRVIPASLVRVAHRSPDDAQEVQDQAGENQQVSGHRQDKPYDSVDRLPFVELS